jgi:hypothetical protein
VGPREHEPLARTRHRDVQQAAHLGHVGLGARPWKLFLQEHVRHQLVGPAAPRHAALLDPEHVHTIELEPLGAVHRHHLHGVRVPVHDRVLLAQAGGRHRTHVFGEVTGGAAGAVTHPRGSQVGELGDVHEPLERFGAGVEQVLLAQPDPLDQAVHEQVRAHLVEGAAGAAVQLQEVLDAGTALGRHVRGVERGPQPRDHVALAPPRDRRAAR